MKSLSLSSMLNIRPVEWPRLLLLYAMIFIFAGVATWSGATLEAAFLQQVGVAGLSWFAITKGVVSIAAIAVYTAFVDRIPNQRLLIAILGLGAVGIAIGLAILALGRPQLAYPWLYLVFFIPLDDIVAAHWFTYMSGFYDAQAAKRVVPVLGTAGSVAAILAGLSLPLMNAWLAPSALLALWMGGLIAVAALAHALPYLLREPVAGQPRRPTRQPMGGAPPPGQLRSFIANIREGTGFVLQSAFLRWMMAATLLTMVLLTLLQYQIGSILLAELSDAASIANFLGVVTSVSNLLVLPIQLFLLSRIIGRIGLGNANLIFPSGILTISGALIAAPALIGTALAHFGRTRFYAICYSIENLLYNAVPLSLKGRARAFINGLVAPLGLLIGGVLLLMAQQSTQTWIMPTLIMLVAAAYLLSALAVRSHYGQALVDLLARDDFSYLLAADAASLSAADPATVRELRRRLETGASNELTIFLARLLSESGGPENVALLGKIARSHDAPNVRAAILDLLAAAGAQAQAVRALCTDLLGDPSPAVRLAAINGLDLLYGPDRQSYQLSLQPLLDDPDVTVRAQALPAYLGNQEGPYYAAGLSLLDTMLHSPARAERVLGLQAIVRAGAPQLLPRLIEHLQDPADELRLAAVVALETMSEARISPDLTPLIVAQLPQLAGDRVERVRQAAMVVLGRLAPDSPLLIAALADPAPPVREAAITALARAGALATPALLAALDRDDLLQAAMAAVALTRIRRSEFATLIDTYVTRCMQAIHRNYTYLELVTPYRSFAGGDILCGILNEQADRWGDTLFDLLGALHPPEAVRLIGASLRHADPLMRANATEALETLLPPQLAHVVAALCDPDLDLAQKVQVGAAMGPGASLDAAATLRQLLDAANDPWLRAVVAFLLGELGAALADPAAPALVAGMTSEGANAPPMATISAGVGVHAATWLSSRTALAAKLLQLQDDPSAEVRLAARSAQRLMAQSSYPGASAAMQQLSNVEKVILLKGVTFFQGMTTAQLCLLATVCEEEQHPQDSHIFRTGEPGESLYIVISGRVGIEQERRRGTAARLATLSSRDFFGEIGLFMGGERGASAIALQDTLTLRLRRAPLIELVRQRPDLSLTLINVLSRRLREAHDQIAELTHVWPKKLDQLLDQLESQ